MLITTLGILGAMLILLAYFMLQFDKWDHNDLSFDVTNLVGSLFLVINGVGTSAWPFVVLNSFFAVISLRDIMAHYTKTPKGVKGLFYKIRKALGK